MAALLVVALRATLFVYGGCGGAELLSQQRVYGQVVMSCCLTARSMCSCSVGSIVGGLVGGGLNGG